jgi:hypothetical protein
MTAIGISNPRTAAETIALTQIFEAMPTSVNCHHYPTKIECGMLIAVLFLTAGGLPEQRLGIL